MKRLSFPHTVVSIAIALAAGFGSGHIGQTVAIAAPAASAPNNDEQSEAGRYIPRDLEDCFRELDKRLPGKEQKKFVSGTEDDVALYHLGLGMSLRNGWELWKGSRLSRYFNGLGIYHPDDMSGIILDSYWRRKNHRPIQLQKQIAVYQNYWETAKKEEREEKLRVERVQVKIDKMMLHPAYRSDSPLVAKMALGIRSDMRARFSTPFRDGIFLTVRQGFEQGKMRYVPYFFDTAEGKLHPIHVAAVRTIFYSVAAGDHAWVTGETDGQAVLVEIGNTGSPMVPLPRKTPVPQLGLSGGRLLAVYPDAVFRKHDGDWETIYRGDIRLPMSGLPPNHVGDRIFFRDEGHGEDDKRLWWLTLKPKPVLTSIDRDCRLVGSDGPRWENCFSYCVTADGTLWASLGGNIQEESLICRQPDGAYRIATFNSRFDFDGQLIRNAEPFGPGADAVPYISISGLTTTDDGSVIGLGSCGIYSITRAEIVQLLAFENTLQKIPQPDGNLADWRWDASGIVAMNDGSYFVTGTFGGVFRIARDVNRQWQFEELENRVGPALDW